MSKDPSSSSSSSLPHAVAVEPMNDSAKQGLCDACEGIAPEYLVSMDADKEDNPPSYYYLCDDCMTYKKSTLELIKREHEKKSASKSMLFDGKITVQLVQWLFMFYFVVGRIQCKR